MIINTVPKTVPKLIFAFPLILLFSCTLFPDTYAQDDPNAQYIVLESGELQSESREVEIPVEVGLWKLQFNLQSNSQIENGVNWTVLTPSGKPLVLTEPNVSVTNPTDKRSIVIWDPRPGKWMIRLSGKGRYSLSATAQGELNVCCIQLWGRNGVFGMEKFQPTRGQQQQAQVYASGFNIETIRFDLINEQGSIITPIKFRQSDFSNPYNFTMLIETPEYPFRIIARGRDMNGKRYQRIFHPLVRPQSAEPANVQNEVSTSNQPPGPLTALPQEWNKTTVEGEFKIVRAQVVKWNDEALLSEKGNPIGIRLKYSIRFPADGSYSPQPQVYPERIAAGYTGALGMRVIKGSVEPMPEGIQNSSQFFFGARANFKSDTTYNFTVDVVPYYAAFDNQKKSFCLATKSYGQPGLRERFNREVMSEQKLRFRLSFSGTDLDGRFPTLTENVYVPNVWYRSFLKDGAAECP